MLRDQFQPPPGDQRHWHGGHIASATHVGDDDATCRGQRILG
jgi:hypothetical protein